MDIPQPVAGSSGFSSLLPKLSLTRSGRDYDEGQTPPSSAFGEGTPLSFTPPSSYTDASWMASLGGFARSRDRSITILNTGVVNDVHGGILLRRSSSDRSDGIVPNAPIPVPRTPSESVKRSSSVERSQERRPGLRERRITFAPLPTTNRARAFTTGRHLWPEADDARGEGKFKVVLRDDDGQVVEVVERPEAGSSAPTPTPDAVTKPSKDLALEPSPSLSREGAPASPARRSSSRGHRLLGSWALGFRKSGSGSTGVPLTRTRSLNDLWPSKSGALGMRRTKSKDSEQAAFDSRRIIYPPVAQRRAMATGRTIHVPEPEFIEWDSADSLPRPKPTNVDADAGDGGAAAEDDGSGMAWLKKRRREREARGQGPGTSQAGDSVPPSPSTPIPSVDRARTPTPTPPATETATASTPGKSIEEDEVEDDEGDEQDDDEASDEVGGSAGRDEDLDEEELRQEEILQAQAKSGAGRGITATAAGKEVYHDRAHHKLVMHADADEAKRVAVGRE